MIVTDSKERDLLLHNTVGRELVIRFPDDNIEISSDNIVSESMSLTRSIIDGKELKFGGCIASQFKIKVIDVDKIQGISADLTGKNIEVSLKQTVRPLLYPSINLFPREDLFPCGANVVYEWRIFTGKIDSALRQKNRAVREIIAYDDFYNKVKNIYQYFTGAAAQNPNIALNIIREFAEYIFEHDNDNPDLVLFNDNTALSLTLENARKVENSKLTTTDFLSAYAELNASFAVMDRFNTLRYINLQNSQTEQIHCYADLDWEEYETAPINEIKFSYNIENNLFYRYGFESDNPSVYISNNIITQCCSDISDLITAFWPSGGKNYIFNNIYKYRPYSATLFDYWWLEPGDKVEIQTGVADTPTISSYVFSITISGIQSIKVKINANGEKYLGKEEEDDVQ